MINKDEYLKKLKELASIPGNINGIYNYCDRWCERCIFTHKCLNYAIQNAAGYEKDSENIYFWENLHIIFEATKQMLEDDMDRLGIKIDYTELEPYENSDIVKYKSTERNPLTRQAKEHGMEVLKWLDNFQKKNHKLAQMGINVDSNSPNLKNAIEVIGWYALFISAKINRALNFFNDDLTDETMKADSDGSAKIALVAINRSIEAWTFLYSLQAADEENIFKFLIELSSLKKQVENLFPDAWKFIRPGFDEL
jgi:hypothetical protein